MRIALVPGMLLFTALACDRFNTSPCDPYWPEVPVVSYESGVKRALQLEELWRVGGLNDTQELASPTSIALSATGYTAVADYQLAEVFVIRPDGQWQESWARRGYGPGELTMPVATAWVEDTLRVFDIEQAKVVSFVAESVSGTERTVPPSFVRPIVTSGEIEFVAVRGDGSVLLKHPLNALNQPGKAATAVLISRPGIERPDTVVNVEVPIVTWGRGEMLPAPGAPRPVVAVGADGWMAIAAPDGSYRVLLISPSDEAVYQVCRPRTPTDLRPVERGEGLQTGGPEDAAAALAGSERSRTLANIGRLLVGPAGEVWVETVRPAPFTNESLYGVAGSRFDVFDHSGQFIGEVQAPAGVAMQAISHERAIGLTFGAFDEPIIIAYRILGQP